MLNTKIWVLTEGEEVVAANVWRVRLVYVVEEGSAIRWAAMLVTESRFSRGGSHLTISSSCEIAGGGGDAPRSTATNQRRMSRR